MKRAVRAGCGISIVMAVTVADEVAAGQLIALPIKAVDLAKELKIVTPLYPPPASPAARFVTSVADGIAANGIGADRYAGNAASTSFTQ